MHEDPKYHETKRTTFTYCGKEVRQITKLFKNMQLKVAFRTQNTINSILKHHLQTDEYYNFTGQA
jgi:hypothetical protein